jgi:hypothetical protein
MKLFLYPLFAIPFFFHLLMLLFGFLRIYEVACFFGDIECELMYEMHYYLGSLKPIDNR